MTDATTTDDEKTICETCGRVLSLHEINELGDECMLCYNARRFTCTGCGELVDAEDATDGHPGLCQDCVDLVTGMRFVCSECEELTDLEDAVDGRPGVCQSCVDAENEARLEALKDKLNGLIERILDTDEEDFIARVLTAVRAVKRRVR